MEVTGKSEDEHRAGLCTVCFHYRFYGSSSYSDLIFSVSFYTDAQKTAGLKVWLVFFYWFLIFIKHLLSQHPRNSIHFQSLSNLHSLNLWLLSPKWGNLSSWHLPKCREAKSSKSEAFQIFKEMYGSEILRSFYREFFSFLPSSTNHSSANTFQSNSPRLSPAWGCDSVTPWAQSSLWEMSGWLSPWEGHHIPVRWA